MHCGSQAKQVLAREPSEVQLHFNRDTWKTLAEAERKLASAEEAAKQPVSSAQTSSEVRYRADLRASLRC